MATTQDGWPILFRLGFFEFNRQYKDRCSPRMRKVMEDLELAMNEDNNTHLLDDCSLKPHNNNDNIESTYDAPSKIQLLESIPTIDGKTAEHAEQIQTTSDSFETKTQTTNGLDWNDANGHEDFFGLNYSSDTVEPPTDTYTSCSWNTSFVSSTPSSTTSIYPSPEFGESERSTVYPCTTTDNKYRTIKTQKTKSVDTCYCSSCQNKIKAIFSSVPYKRQRRF